MNMGTKRSSVMMNDEELRKCFNVSECAGSNGILLGKCDSRYVGLKRGDRGMRNVLVIGNPDTGNRECLLGNAILEYRDRGESMIVNDPHGKLCGDYRGTLRSSGYDVIEIDLANPGSYRIDLMRLAGTDERLANALSLSLMLNTDSEVNETGYSFFWDDARRRLLTALILYVNQSDADPEHKTLRTLWDVLIGSDPDSLNMMFKGMDDDLPCKKNYQIFASSHKTTKECVISSLKNRLSFLLDDNTAKLFGNSDYDYERLANGKFALFILNNARVNELRHMPAVIVTMLRMFLLEKVADDKRKPAHFILDSFDHIGILGEQFAGADIEKYLDETNVMNMDHVICVQSLESLSCRYMTWENLARRFDVRIVFDCEDEKTAGFMTSIGKEVTERQKLTCLDMFRAKNDIRLMFDGYNASRNHRLSVPGGRFSVFCDEMIVSVRGEKFTHLKRTLTMNHPQ